MYAGISRQRDAPRSMLSTFFHETVDAVLQCILRFDANDGDDGALGSVKAYIGIAEEQFGTVRTGLLSFLRIP